MPNPPEARDINKLIADAKVPTVSVPPAPPKPAPGAFTAQDGRTLYRYDLDGETVVLPKPLDKMTEQDYYNLPQVMSAVMPGRISQNLTVKFKDPQWVGYWFNKKAGSGARVSVARSLGFIPATKDDVEKIVAGLDDTDGSIEQHDVVLFKIHKHKLYSKYAEWISMARVRGGIESYKNNADSFVRNAGGDMSKGNYYLTPQAREEFQGLGPVVNLPTVGTQ